MKEQRLDHIQWWPPFFLQGLNVLKQNRHESGFRKHILFWLCLKQLFEYKAPPLLVDQ